MAEWKCTECWTKEYIIVASWDAGWFFFGVGNPKRKVRICDKCFEIAHGNTDESMLCKRPLPPTK